MVIGRKANLFSCRFFLECHSSSCGIRTSTRLTVSVASASVQKTVDVSSYMFYVKKSLV